MTGSTYRVLAGAALIFSLACGSDDEADATTMAASTTGSGSDGATSSVPATSDPSGTPGTTQSPPAEDSTTNASTANDSTVSASTANDTTTGGGSVPMICQPACRDVSDCCALLKNPPGCPDAYPFNFACADGACIGGVCRDDDDCAANQGSGETCESLGGQQRCVSPCTTDGDCRSIGLDGTCTGVSDDGTTFCVYDSSDRCTDAEDCQSLGGVCIDGICGCVDDDDCGLDAACTPDLPP